MPSFAELAKKKLEEHQNSKSDYDKKLDLLKMIDDGSLALRFVEDVKKYGTTDNNSPLNFTPWFLESLRLIGDLRISEVYSSGAAQIGKSTGNYLFAVWLLVEAKLRLGWAYSNENVLLRLKPQQFDQYYLNWLRRKNEDRDKADSFNTKVTSHKGGVCNTIFVNKPGAVTDGAAAAGANIVSFTADIMFEEERSQYLPGANEPLKQRLNYSILPTKPRRCISTKGSGQGIEAEIKNASHYFLPAAICKGCGKQFSLHSFGCLLKAQTEDKDPFTGTFLDKANRIVDWHHHDPENAVKTAYFGCPYCGTEIDKGQRVNAFFHDHYTQVRLSDFLDNFENDINVRTKIGIDLSPLVRDTVFNLAAELIQQGLTTSNFADYLQQSLSVAFESFSRRITEEKIIKATQIVLPKRKNKLVVGSLDQGRASHYMTISTFYYEDGENPLSCLNTNTCDLLYCSPVTKYEILQKLKDFKADYFAFDADPNRSYAKQLMLETSEFNPLMLQNKPRQNEILKEISIKDAGDLYTAYGIRTNYFMTEILSAFEQARIKVPREWIELLKVSKKVDNPPRQFLDPRFDEAEGSWIRSASKNDDLFFSLSFSYSALYFHLANNVGQTIDWYKYIS
jgi:hypothetical protein